VIHIVGINHELQHTAPPWRAALEEVQRARREFQTYLCTLAGRLKPQVIAEEFSQQALDNLSKAHNLSVVSTVKAVADTLGVEHRFCDPDDAERLRLGLPDPYLDHYGESEKPRFDRIRECYWLSRLVEVSNRDVLFVCGAEHVQSFCELVKGTSIDANIVNEYFGREIYVS
jgi:hypothetical protein